MKDRSSDRPNQVFAVALKPEGDIFVRMAKPEAKQPGSITRRIDPLADEANLGATLSQCLTPREKRLVSLRALYLTQREIAAAVGMSTGWTCESLAELRLRCGWGNVRRRKPMKRRKSAT
jgi:hypothetical protein